MVETATFLGLIMFGCVTILIVMVTVLLILMGWELMVEKWRDIKNR